MYRGEILDVPILLATLLLVSAVLYWRRQRRLRLPYPPGPPGLPLIGNALDVPKTKQWVAYANLSRKIGSPIVHHEVLGTHIVTINDFKTAHEVLERRASPYVSRPAWRMLREIQGHDFSWALWPYGDTWKTCRRHTDGHLRPVEARKIRPLETKMTREVLLKLLNEPDDYVHHLRFFICSILLEISFGVRIMDSHDLILQIAESTLEGGKSKYTGPRQENSCLSPVNDSTNYPFVEIFPWVARLPDWLPGMEWKTKVKAWKQNNRQMRDVPFAAAKQALQDNTTNNSIITQLLESQDQNKGLSDNVVKATALTLITAGLDTTTSVLLWAILLSHLYPAAQETAQAELDDVLGGARLPTFEDQSQLPFIQAFCKEILRYTCIVPLCLPHVSTDDDIWNYDGKQYLIPKGSVVMPNAWAMTRNSDTYPRPDEFNPWRFLKEDGTLNPEIQEPSMVFGFRPRHCPGKAMAEDMLFIFVASFLAVFKVESKTSNTTTDKDFDFLHIPGLVLYPVDVPCSISPRNENGRSILQAGGTME